MKYPQVSMPWHDFEYKKTTGHRNSYTLSTFCKLKILTKSIKSRLYITIIRPTNKIETLVYGGETNKSQ